MRTRSDVARQRSLLKLPDDCLRNVALFIDCDVDAARLALTSRRVMRSMTPTVWAQILKATHGGLKIAAAETDGLRVAARLAAARADEGPVDGFFALATNCGAAPYAQQQYWADALFRREPWRIYCSRSNPGGEPVLCAAAFLVIDDDNWPDIRWMLDGSKRTITSFRDTQMGSTPWSRCSWTATHITRELIGARDPCRRGHQGYARNFIDAS